MTRVNKIDIPECVARFVLLGDISPERAGELMLECAQKPDAWEKVSAIKAWERGLKIDDLLVAINQRDEVIAGRRRRKSPTAGGVGENG